MLDMSKILKPVNYMCNESLQWCTSPNSNLACHYTKLL